MFPRDHDRYDGFEDVPESTLALRWCWRYSLEPTTLTIALPFQFQAVSNHDLTKKTLTSLWRNILQIADELKPDIPIEEQVFTNSPLFPVACMRCDIYPYVEKPKPLEKNASRFSSVVDESAAAKIKELKQKKKARNRK